VIDDRHKIFAMVLYGRPEGVRIRQLATPEVLNYLIDAGLMYVTGKGNVRITPKGRDWLESTLS
jgi:hypothetical protein